MSEADLAEWLHAMHKFGGKGVVNNIDARALGRCGDEISDLRERVAVLEGALGQSTDVLQMLLDDEKAADTERAEIAVVISYNTDALTPEDTGGK